MSEVPIVLDPEIGTRTSKVCWNCGTLMNEIQIGPTSVFMCRSETHAAIIIEHPEGETPIVVTREGLRQAGPEQMQTIIFGDKKKETISDFICPFGCGFSTDSNTAYNLHIQSHEANVY